MGMGNRFVIALVLHTRNRNFLVAGTNAGLYKTSDGGNTWVLAPTESKPWAVNALVFDSQHTDTVYAATDRGLYEVTFGDADRPMTVRPMGLNDQFVTAMAFPAGMPQRRYAGGSGGIYRTTDGARSWHLLSHSPRAITGLLIHPHRPATLFAGTTRGLYKSEDDGAHWVRITMS